MSTPAILTALISGQNIKETQTLKPRVLRYSRIENKGAIAVSGWVINPVAPEVLLMSVFTNPDGWMISEPDTHSWSDDNG